MLPSPYLPWPTDPPAPTVPDTRTDDCRPCLPPCQGRVFERLSVSYLLRGGTLVSWELTDTFRDPAPLSFQLEVGGTANQDSDDWETIGLPVVDGLYAVDDQQRVYGKTNWTHYRVRLTAPSGEYLSPAIGLLGILDHRDWRLAQEIYRKEELRSRSATQQGYLLKRRITGTACECVDPQLGESRNPECPLCYGTGIRCGYMLPLPCVWADFSPRTHRTAIDAGGRGTTNNVVTRCRMSLLVPVFQNDVWCSRRTDDRYYIHNVQHIAEHRGVPLVGQVEMRLAPVSDPIYNVVIPDQTS